MQSVIFLYIYLNISSSLNAILMQTQPTDTKESFWH